MLTVERVDPRKRTEVRRFIDVPFDLYRADPHWVPPLRREAALLLDRRRHPFYEHSEAAFFVAVRDGRQVGRIAALELRPYNRVHDVRQVSISLFDCEEDRATAAGLVDRVMEWGKARGLTTVVGPRGLSALDGYGVLVHGYERRQLMTMTGYNGPWYGPLLEALGFTKEVDFVTFELLRDTFVMPEAVRRAAARASALMRVERYPNKRTMLRAARSVGRTYNRAFTGNWEYYPLTEREVDFVVEQVRPLLDPRLVTLMAAGEDIVGFLLAFPDVSAALQRARGRLTPLSLVGLFREVRRTTSVALNGAGILPEYQGRGGNALLYTHIEAAIRAGRFVRAELPQVAESATRMRHDLEKLGATPIKVHRVYRRTI